MDTDKLNALLEKHEGRVPFMYSDRGPHSVVTVGVGHALFTVGMAESLPFFYDGAMAQRERIAEAWELVKRTGQGGYPVYLQESAIDSLLQADRDNAIAVSKRTFPQYDDYPECVQEAIADMAFNLGSFVEFPRFSAAVRSRNWTVAAQECLRCGVGTQRNLDTQRLLLEAKQAAST